MILPDFASPVVFTLLLTLTIFCFRFPITGNDDATGYDGHETANNGPWTYGSNDGTATNANETTNGTAGKAVTFNDIVHCELAT